MRPQHNVSEGLFPTIYKCLRSYVEAERMKFPLPAFGNNTLLGRRNTEVIRMLYEETSLQCKLCGIQHTMQKGLREHLDKHFLESKAERHARSKTRARVAFQTKEAWMMGIKQSESTENQEQPLILFDEKMKLCYGCGLAFDVDYSQELKSWVFTNAVCVELAGKPDLEARVFMHKSCYRGFEIASKASTELDSLSTDKRFKAPPHPLDP
jgi:hypothetical protein